jgi:hypothetical protein
VGPAYIAANARIYVNTSGYVQNVEVRTNGAYWANATLTANIGGLRFYENNQVYDATTNSLSNVSLTIGVSNKGNGHPNGVFTLSGGDPSRGALVRVETFPSNTRQIVSITANSNAHGVNGFVNFSGGGTDNIAANARIYVTSTGLINGVVMFANGLYTGTPTVTANIGNAVLTLTTLPVDGQIRRIVVEDPGLYFSTPTATLNNSPNSVISILSNTAENIFTGNSIANGFLIFGGGLAVRPASANYSVYPSNGTINMQSIVITDVGLYRIPPTTVSPNVVPVSITEVLPLIGGSGYVNGNVVFSTTQGTANIVANCTVFTNGAFGAIQKTVIQHTGLYANGQDIIIVGILNPATGALQTPTTQASFSVGYNSNTRNVANLVVSTSANLSQSAIVFVSANGNNFTNAAITATTVANDQTNAVITVGFTEQNTAANVLVEVYNSNGAIRKLTVNTQSVLRGTGSYYYTPDVTPNSGGTGAVITINPVSWYQTANVQRAIIISANSSIRVMTESDIIIITEQGKDIVLE